MRIFSATPALLEAIERSAGTSFRFSLVEQVLLVNFHPGLLFPSSLGSSLGANSHKHWRA